MPKAFNSSRPLPPMKSIVVGENMTRDAPPRYVVWPINDPEILGIREECRIDRKRPLDLLYMPNSSGQPSATGQRSRKPVSTELDADPAALPGNDVSGARHGLLLGNRPGCS